MIVIIDYGIGNLGSVANALKRLGKTFQISSDPFVLKKASMLVLPGVGAAAEGMRNLKERGLDNVIVERINKGCPFLGICLGMQLLFQKSEEGNVKCLGILKGKVKKFQTMRKVPQIGWNDVKLKVQSEKLKVNGLFKNILDKSYFYFVNGYYCDPDDKSIVAATTEYGEEFVSVVVKDNIVATQFHPEKSGKTGMKFLQNWSTL